MNSELEAPESARTLYEQFFFVSKTLLCVRAGYHACAVVPTEISPVLSVQGVMFVFCVGMLLVFVFLWIYLGIMLWHNSFADNPLMSCDNNNIAVVLDTLSYNGKAMFSANFDDNRVFLALSNRCQNSFPLRCV